MAFEERKCQLCGDPYMARMYDFSDDHEDSMPFTPVYDGDKVRLKKQEPGKVAFYDYDICPFCATDIRNFILSLRKENKDG